MDFLLFVVVDFCFTFFLLVVVLLAFVVVVVVVVGCVDVVAEILQRNQNRTISPEKNRIFLVVNCNCAIRVLNAQLFRFLLAASFGSVRGIFDTRQILY
jgi:hypothetical protein